MRQQHCPYVKDFHFSVEFDKATDFHVAETRWGLGLEVDDIPPQNVLQFQKVQYVGGPLYAIGVLGFKLSLLLTYLRFAGFQRKYRIILWTVIVAATLNSVIFAFVFAFTCTPPAKTWNRELPGSCLNELAFYFAFASSNIMFDILVIALPFPVLKQLQLDVRKKVGLGVLFGLGIFVTIVQIMRIQTIASLKTYTGSQKPIMWSMVEIHVGVIISCIPTYTPLLRTVRSKLTTYSNSRGKSGADKEESGVVRVSNMPSSTMKSGGKSKMSSSRLSAIMDDEIALCDVPDRGFRTWVGRKEPLSEESSRENIREKDPGHTFGASDPRKIMVTQEVRVSDGQGPL